MESTLNCLKSTLSNSLIFENNKNKLITCKNSIYNKNEFNNFINKSYIVKNKNKINSCTNKLHVKDILSNKDDINFFYHKVIKTNILNDITNNIAKSKIRKDNNNFKYVEDNNNKEDYIKLNININKKLNTKLKEPSKSNIDKSLIINDTKQYKNKYDSIYTKYNYNTLINNNKNHCLNNSKKDIKVKFYEENNINKYNNFNKKTIINSNNKFTFKKVPISNNIELKNIKNKIKHRNINNSMHNFNNYLIRNHVYLDIKDKFKYEADRQWRLSEDFHDNLLKKKLKRIKDLNNMFISKEDNCNKLLNHKILKSKKGFDNVSSNSSKSSVIINKDENEFMYEKSIFNDDNMNNISSKILFKNNSTQIINNKHLVHFNKPIKNNCNSNQLVTKNLINKNSKKKIEIFNKNISCDLKTIKKLNLLSYKDSNLYKNFKSLNKFEKMEFIKEQKIIQKLAYLNNKLYNSNKKYESLIEPINNKDLININNFKKCIKRKSIEVQCLESIRNKIFNSKNALKLKLQSIELSNSKAKLGKIINFVPRFLKENNKFNSKTNKTYLFCKGYGFGIGR